MKEAQVWTRSPADTARSGVLTATAAPLGLTPAERIHLERGLIELTPRELEVACAVCEGGDNEQVADRLCIAVPTLRTHLMRIYRKLNVVNKGDLVWVVSERLLEGYRDGAIAPPGSASSRNSMADNALRESAEVAIAP